MVVRLEIFDLMSKKRVVVIGAGAAGMMAAGRAAESGAFVTILEKMERPGRKVFISGNTRCNLTNARTVDEFILMYGQNGRFLHRAFQRFFRDDLLNLLAIHNVKTTEEQDGRIFPASGKSADVVRSLTSYVIDNGAILVTGARVVEIEKTNGELFSVHTPTADYRANAVVLAVGGASYPQTGSTGDGYRLAEKLGHSITSLRPAHVPLIVRDRMQIHGLQGVSLQNIRVTAFSCTAENIQPGLVPSTDVGRGIHGKKARPPLIESRTGDVIFTHYGVSGPAVLRMSLAVAGALEQGPVSLSMDLFPATDERQLDRKLRELTARHGSRRIQTILAGLVPARLVDQLLKTCGSVPNKIANQVSAQERQMLIKALKNIRLDIEATRPLAEAMVTAGGVCLAEINPHTMESRLVKGLYFCGEILDIDAETGGYNLQAAFSTGYLAGESAAGPN
jgi:predicted flavoprotein YhiN